MKAMVLIADYSCMPLVQSIFTEENIPCRFLIHGFGSADSQMLDYLGLGENKKITAVSFIADSKVMHLYDTFNKRLSLTEAGRGIAFTMPLTGASGTAFALNETKPELEGKTEMNDAKYELIITIVNRGGFEAVKEAAKAAGLVSEERRRRNSSEFQFSPKRTLCLSLSRRRTGKRSCRTFLTRQESSPKTVEYAFLSLLTAHLVSRASPLTSRRW